LKNIQNTETIQSELKGLTYIEGEISSKNVEKIFKEAKNHLKFGNEEDGEI